MADPSSWRIRAALAGLIGLLAAGCVAGPQAGEDDPSAPVLFTALVVDTERAPVPGARYQLLVFAEADAFFDRTKPPVIDDLYSAGSDGRFDVHLEPTPGLRALARATGGLIPLTVFVIDPDRDLVFPFGTSRGLGSDAWAGEPLLVEISPHREYWEPMERYLLASPPAET